MNKLEIIKNLNILYAEDNDDIRDKIASILKLMFGNVYIASNGTEAIKLYKENRIDVIITDYVMPFFDGHEVAKFIRNIDKTIPIIITSAFTDKDKLLKVIELNYIQYIEKPIVFEDLNNAINKAIEILNDNNRLLVNLKNDFFYNYIKKSIIKENNSICEEIKLSKNEIAFIELLLSKRNQLFTNDIIENYIFKASVEQNTIRNLIYRLRKKVDIDFIITIKDLGYMISN